MKPPSPRRLTRDLQQQKEDANALLRRIDRLANTTTRPKMDRVILLLAADHCHTAARSLAKARDIVTDLEHRQHKGEK